MGSQFFRNDMKVDLLDYMGSDLSIVDAARVSYGGKRYRDKRKNERLIRFLLRNSHTSPFRHTAFTYYLEVPIFVARQLMRHHVGFTWNEVSGRYKEAGSLGFYAPSDMILNPHYSLVVSKAYGSYMKLLEEGTPREIARAVLPLGTYTAIRVTANLGALMNLWRERISPHAQNETREAAELMWLKFRSLPAFEMTSRAIEELWLGGAYIPGTVLVGKLNRLPERDVRHYEELLKNVC